MQEKTGERERERKGDRGKKEEGRRAEEERDKEIKKDVIGWTVVTRCKKQKRKTSQIFVKAVGKKKVLREVSPEDKVQKIPNTVSGSDQDVYATCEGRMLRKDDQLKSCGVRDGSTIQIMSRMRGGGRHKDKRSKAEKKRATDPERPDRRATKVQ